MELKRLVRRIPHPIVLALLVALLVGSSGTLTPAPSLAEAANSGRFVTTCGIKLCLNGRPYPLFGATMYHRFDQIPDTIKRAQDLHLNTIRIVNQFPTVSLPLNADPDAYARDETSWRKVDNVIAQLAAAKMHAILDLSDYRNFLQDAKINPYTKDWGPYLNWVATRVNTVTGVRYAADPTIALVSFAGEIVAPNDTTHNTLGVTPQQEVDFFNRTFAEWKALDRHHLTSSGALGSLDWPSGILWKPIMSLAQGNVCSIHTYSPVDLTKPGDLTTTVPAISNFCGGLGKPWIDEEFGACLDLYPSDAARAARVQYIYDTNRQYRSAGTIFWNLGEQSSGTTCDIGPQFPLTFAAVLRNAPK